MKKLITKNYFFTWEQPMSIILVALFCFSLSSLFANTNTLENSEFNTSTRTSLNLSHNYETASLLDEDKDDVSDDIDNCVGTYNPAQADYDGDGIGDLCDDAHDCTDILSVRRAINLESACGNVQERVIWVNGAMCKEIGDLYFTEYTNGTAKLTGRVQEVDGSAISDVNVTFTGKSTSGTPYIGCATQDYISDWYYYADFSGTIGGLNVVPNPDHNFQVGYGANVKNDNYGASGWFNLDGTASDFNFDLGPALTCATDADDDGIDDNIDNCVNTYNPSQADYDKDGIGDVCDSAHDCEKITSIRRVQNLENSCEGSADRVLYIQGAILYSEISDLYFVEYDNGTATLKGKTQKVGGTEQLDVDITFTGKSATNGSPYVSCSSDANSADWYYYPHFSGTIGGQNVTPNPNHNFQVGFGANAKNDNYGASGWFTLGGTAADFNFDLGEPLNCESIGCGEITGFQIIDINNTSGNTVIDFSADQTYCETQFTSDIRIRALVGGDHESLEFTINGPNGLELINTENFVTYDSKLFWASPGTYTINAKLYKEENLEGTLCDEQTITLVIKETCGASIGNKVFFDNNANGLQDSNEPGVENVTVNLVSAGNDGQFGTSDDVIEATETTDENGMYLFENVEAGNYAIQIDLTTLPVQYGLSFQNVGNDDTQDSDFNLSGLTQAFTVIAGQDNDLNFDAGIFAQGTIGNYVWEDTNGNGLQDGDENGIQGVFIFLLDENGDDIPNITYEVTDENGFYQFKGVPFGSYVVRFATPSGYQLTRRDAGNDDLDSDASLVDGETAIVNIDVTDSSNQSLDAGFVVPLTVCGKVWLDESEEGQRDGTEIGVEGVKVSLFDAGVDKIAGTADDQGFGFTITDEFGEYCFYQVRAGTFYVVFDPSTAPEGYFFTESKVGNDDLADSDADPVTGQSPTFALTSGINYIGTDAGLISVSSLPVVLTRFEAFKTNCFTQLEWATSEEIDFSHFEMEYSTNRVNFRMVDVIPTKGGRGVLNYSTTHKNTAENNYYRLKMVDLDGSFEYSEIVNIIHDCNASNGMSIYPNPVEKQVGEIAVKFFSAEEFTNIHVIDGMGRIIETIPQEVTLDWNVANLNVSHLPSGIYYIMIDGNRLASRFIIAE